MRLKGIENPIDIKFKKRKNGYSAIVCELYRALKQRKNKYTEEIERQLKEELAVVQPIEKLYNKVVELQKNLLEEYLK